MNRRGFTLIEVMVAMAVLSIGVAATLPMIALSVNRGTHARKLTTAQHLGTEVVERLRTEIRFDAMAESSPALTPGSEWKFDVLPHRASPPAGTVAGAGCQPAGLDDGIAYHYGPIPFQREGQDYLVCYQMVTAGNTDAKGNNRIGIPVNSAEVRIRVLWRGADGRWTSWSLSDLLHAGAAS